jgi:hypothetical protein
LAPISANAVGDNGGGLPDSGLPEHIPSEEEGPVIVERLIAWFVAQNRCCRLGRIVDEVGRDEVRRVALGRESSAPEPCANVIRPCFFKGSL